LAAGYCQICIDKIPQEKTAFTTYQGLFDFRVMPFGLTNAPAVFQQLMQRPESLLSDRGTNLLAAVMQDVCELMGISKLNTTAYHPQCNGVVEWMNRTLKAMLRKHTAKFGRQWDTYLPGVLWAH